MKGALLASLALKDVDRAGWVLRGLEQVESVAAHSWGVCWLVLVLLPPGLDRERALTYAVLHDLAEAWIGDLTPHDDLTGKFERERAAMESLCTSLGRPELLASWLDYEAQIDEESRFVKQLDRLDLGLQAQRYLDKGLDPAEFLESARSGITDPKLLALLG